MPIFIWNALGIAQVAFQLGSIKFPLSQSVGQHNPALENHIQLFGGQLARSRFSRNVPQHFDSVLVVGSFPNAEEPEQILIRAEISPQLHTKIYQKNGWPSKLAQV